MCLLRQRTPGHRLRPDQDCGSDAPTEGVPSNGTGGNRKA